MMPDRQETSCELCRLRSRVFSVEVRGQDAWTCIRPETGNSELVPMQGDAATVAELQAQVQRLQAQLEQLKPHQAASQASATLPVTPAKTLKRAVSFGQTAESGTGATHLDLLRTGDPESMATTSSSSQSHSMLPPPYPTHRRSSRAK